MTPSPVEKLLQKDIFFKIAYCPVTATSGSFFESDPQDVVTQSSISYKLNEKKVGKVYKVLFDRKEGEYFIGRTEFDSPDVDNEVLIDASRHFVRQGDFVQVKVYEASDYDLFAEPV